MRSAARPGRSRASRTPQAAMWRCRWWRGSKSPHRGDGCLQVRRYLHGRLRGTAGGCARLFPPNGPMEERRGDGGSHCGQEPCVRSHSSKPILCTAEARYLHPPLDAGVSSAQLLQPSGARQLPWGVSGSGSGEGVGAWESIVGPWHRFAILGQASKWAGGSGPARKSRPTMRRRPELTAQGAVTPDNQRG